MSTMWHRLAGLVLYGTTALWADVCQGLPPPPSEGSGFSDSIQLLSFRLAVKPDGPAYRITFRSISPGPHTAPAQHAHAGDIEVSRCEDGRRLQSLAVMSFQGANFASTFHAEDVNFDGYLDFAVLVDFGGAWGSESWWVYDPAAGRFVQNELTHELSGL